MFVTSCLDPSVWCHEIGRWSESGPVLCTLAKAHGALGVQKRVPLMAGEENFRDWPESNYPKFTYPGVRRDDSWALCTRVPSGPPLPCGCYLVDKCLISGNTVVDIVSLSYMLHVWQSWRHTCPPPLRSCHTCPRHTCPPHHPHSVIRVRRLVIHEEPPKRKSARTEFHVSTSIPMNYDLLIF